jgi:hypothetical protein
MPKTARLNQSAATDGDVVAVSSGDQYVTWASQVAIQHFQNQVFRAWTSSTTSATTLDIWPVLDTGTGSSVTWATTGNTAIANSVWTTTAWQMPTHTQVRWTPQVVQRTPEQIAEAAAKAELARQERIKEEAKTKIFKDAAKVRARNLLMQMLNADQKKELEEKNHFHLTVHDRSGSMRVYRIEYGYAGNVKLLGTDGQPVKRYCIHADYRLPYEDQMLAQKMLLEANEKEFLRIANMTQLRAA